MNGDPYTLIVFHSGVSIGVEQTLDEVEGLLDMALRQGQSFQLDLLAGNRPVLINPHVVALAYEVAPHQAHPETGESNVAHPIRVERNLVAVT